MVWPFFMSAAITGHWLYRALRSSNWPGALGWGIAYSAGTRIGYNALGFLQPYRSRAYPRHIDLNSHKRRPARRMYRSGAYAAGFRAGRRSRSYGRRRYTRRRRYSRRY